MKVVTNMAKKVVTLYIDDTSLRLLVAKGNRVKKWATLPLESGLIRDGVVIDEAKVVAKIKELFKAQKVSPKKVITGMSGLNSLSQLITLPHLPEAMLAEAVAREAERVLPVPLDELYISWQIIPASGEETLVFLAALHRQTVDAMVKALRQAGVKPYLMDLAPLALTRMVDKATAMVADVRSVEVDIVIMVEGVPQVIRSLSLPSEAGSPENRLSIIREELERTIKFYNSGHPEKPFEPGLPIFVSGELVKAPEARQSLADELKYTILPLPSPLKPPKGFDSSQYMVNIGLAFKELSVEKRASAVLVNLNILPEVYRIKALTLSKVLTPLGTVAAIGTIYFLGMLVQGAVADTANLQNQVDFTTGLLEIRLEKWQAQEDEVAELLNQVGELEEPNEVLTAVLGNFVSQRKIVNGDLKSVISDSNLPGNVDLGGIDHDGMVLTVSGISPSETEVMEYANALNDTGRFDRVTVTSIERAEVGVNFTLTLSD
jgi:type IV pilus assembly protein PilM